MYIKMYIHVFMGDMVIDGSIGIVCSFSGVGLDLYPQGNTISIQSQTLPKHILHGLRPHPVAVKKVLEIIYQDTKFLFGPHLGRSHPGTQRFAVSILGTNIYNPFLDH